MVFAELTRLGYRSDEIIGVEMRVVIYSFLFLLIIPSAYSNITIEQILAKIDKLYRSDSSQAIMTMKIVTPDWSREMEMEVWTEGLENSFVTILSPAKDKGVGTLKLGSEMWNYFPKINKVIKVPPSMMMGSWMGSDFTNDDLVKENTLRDDYIATLLKEDGEKYLIQLIPKEETISVWGKITLEVEKKRLIPIVQEYFDEKNYKVRTMTFDQIKNFGSREIPARMTLVPLTKTGHSTIVEYKELHFNVKIPNGTFTRKNLQKRR